MERILLLSGAVGAGKSSIAQYLKVTYKFGSISSSRYLREQLKLECREPTRLNLQQFSDQLDKSTDYYWVVDHLITRISDSPNITYWLLDGVRKYRQVEHFKRRFPGQIKHVHLTAAESTLEYRFNNRDQPPFESTYQDAISHPNEQAARSLIKVADLIVDTERSLIEEIGQRIAAFCQE